MPLQEIKIVVGDITNRFNYGCGGNYGYDTPAKELESIYSEYRIISVKIRAESYDEAEKILENRLQNLLGDN